MGFKENDDVLESCDVNDEVTLTGRFPPYTLI